MGLKTEIKSRPSLIRVLVAIQEAQKAIVQVGQYLKVRVELLLIKGVCKLRVITCVVQEKEIRQQACRVEHHQATMRRTEGGGMLMLLMKL